jgi:hypothetical protein
MLNSQPLAAIDQTVKHIAPPNIAEEEKAQPNLGGLFNLGHSANCLPTQEDSKSLESLKPIQKLLI